MKKRFIAIILIIVIMMSFMIRTREIRGVKFNNRGDKVFITYRYPGGCYKLFLSDIYSKKEQIIYEGEQWPEVIPSPSEDWVLYTYEDKNSKDEVNVFDYKVKKALLKTTTNLSAGRSLGCFDRLWHPDGNRFFFLSYKGIQVIDVSDKSITNLTYSQKYPVGKDHEGYNCLNWSQRGDLLYYSKSSKLYCFNPINKSNQEIFEADGELRQIEPTKDNRYIIHLEEPEVQECYIGIYDIKTKAHTRLYRMADDGEGDKNRSFGLDISDLYLTKNNQIIFAVCEFDDTNAWGAYDETAIYQLNPFTKKLKKLIRFRDFGSVWDYNQFKNTIVVKSGKNQLKFIKI